CFELVDANGNPLQTTSAVSGITLGAQSAATDPLYDAYDPTTGGGDTGDVMISPYIRPGTVSDVYYNHYSTLRSLEDIFQVSHDRGKTDPGSSGLDGEGHIGYAAQPGLAPFGGDVFTNATTPGTTTVTVTTPGTTTPGKTTTVVYCVVPKLKGDSLTEANLLLKVAQCKVGKIK